MEPYNWLINCVDDVYIEFDYWIRTFYEHNDLYESVSIIQRRISQLEDKLTLPEYSNEFDKNYELLEKIANLLDVKLNDISKTKISDVEEAISKIENK